MLRRILPDEPAVEWVDPSAKVMLVERQVGGRWAGHSIEELDRPAQMRVVVASGKRRLLGFLAEGTQAGDEHVLEHRLTQADAGDRKPGGAQPR